MCMLVHVRVCRNEEEHLLHLGPLAGAQQDGSGACGALTVFSLLANFQSSTTPLPLHVVSCIWGCVCSAVVVAKKKRSAQAKMAPWWVVVRDIIHSIGQQNYSDSIQCSFWPLSPQFIPSA